MEALYEGLSDAENVYENNITRGEAFFQTLVNAVSPVHKRAAFLIGYLNATKCD